MATSLPFAGCTFITVFISQETFREIIQSSYIILITFVRFLHSITITEPFNNMRTLKFKAQPTNTFFATDRQSNVWRLLPASDHCRARGNQIVEHSSDNVTVLG